MKEIFKILNKFSSKILNFYPPCEETKILHFESVVKELPADYKAFLRKSNGFSLMSSVIYGIRNEKEDLISVYLREHNDVEIPMPQFLIPFSPDGQGNFYCFDIKNKNEESCPIIFWTSNYEYDEEDVPEISNESFTEWVKEVIIEWTIEDNDSSDIFD